MTDTLQLAVNGEYFDAMKSGEKKYEYRVRNDYWRKRIEGRSYANLVITKGYPSREDKSRRLSLQYLGYEEQTITHKHFGNVPTDVYAIIVRLENADG